MYYVYRIQSVRRKEKSYIGITHDVKKRLARHNCGKVANTEMDKPYRVSFYAAFTRKERAEAFEAFLKSDEGRAFAHEHLWKGPNQKSSSPSS